ncbi:MAG: helix-turn-helix domain-containing protein [bacterium]|nr:helix-turn-helix domain-containing protein [bacterium]
MSREHPLLRRIGAAVRALRAARKWSRRELADRAALSERFLADVESGAANPSVLRLEGLANALGVELTALFSDVPGAVRHIALLGLRGAGKSTVGAALAETLGREFIELDEQVERATGLGLGEIFQVHGEAYYREAERRALSENLTGPPSVVAVGGGIVTDASSFEMLRARARTVWLRAAPEDHWQRVIAQGDTRPMADNERAFTDLRRILAEREPFYRQADFVVDTSGHEIEAVVARVRRELAGGNG